MPPNSQGTPEGWAYAQKADAGKASGWVPICSSLCSGPCGLIPEGASMQYLKIQVPETISSILFATRNCVLGTLWVVDGTWGVLRGNWGVLAYAYLGPLG